MLLEKPVQSFSMEPAQSMRTISSGEVQPNYKSNQEVSKNATNLNIPQYPKLKIAWRNLIIFAIFHTISIYGAWLMMTQMMWSTFIFFGVYAAINIIGVTMGAHRLWSHRSYKAKLPLRILLMLCQTTAYQGHIYNWARDHRAHHKFSDTNADPHNTTRGFFFAHIGCLMVRKHKDVMIKGETIDLSDIVNDPVVMFQKRHYYPMMLLLCFIIPVFIPCYFWGEDWWLSLIVVGITRYVYSLNVILSINSLAHTSFGVKPYDKRISPAEHQFIAWLSYGEGWHNYHHAFPWDYKTAELGNFRINITTIIIDLMAILGLAYDLKTASPEIIKKRAQRTGDGTWGGDSSSGITNGTIGRDHHHVQDDSFWGWGDTDMKQDDIEQIKAYNKLRKI